MVYEVMIYEPIKKIFEEYCETLGIKITLLRIESKPFQHPNLIYGCSQKKKALGLNRIAKGCYEILLNLEKQ